jgi:hypothetical protein
MGIDPSCYSGSAPTVTANSRLLSTVLWADALLTVDLSSLSIGLTQHVSIVIVPSAGDASQREGA